MPKDSIKNMIARGKEYESNKGLINFKLSKDVRILYVVMPNAPPPEDGKLSISTLLNVILKKYIANNIQVIRNNKNLSFSWRNMIYDQNIIQIGKIKADNPNIWYIASDKYEPK